MPFGIQLHKLPCVRRVLSRETKQLNLNYYQLLGVSESAATEEIRDGYRKQAMKWHPDRNPNNRLEAEERFKEIAHAYRVLSNQGSRTEYDSWLNNQATGTGNSNPGGASQSGDADQLFFEQMMDLGFELASRGFNEQIILKTLLSLECPEAVARAVANSSVRARHRSPEPVQTTARGSTEDVVEPPKEYAGFWRRFVGFSLDSIVLMLPYALLVYLLTDYWGINIVVASALSTLLLAFIYEGYMISRRGTTFGKDWVGIRVLRNSSGENLSFVRAGTRSLARYLSWLTVYVGFLIQPFTKHRQALHDFVVDSVVVRVGAGRGSILPIAIIFLVVLVFGMVAAVALPAYDDYMSRSRVVTGVQLLQSLKGAASKHITEKQMVPESVDSLGVPIQRESYFQEVAVDRSGALYVEFNKDAGSQLAGKHVVLLPYMTKDGFLWACGSTDVKPHLLPASCNTTAFPQGIGEHFRETLETSDKVGAEEQRRVMLLVDQIERTFPALDEKSRSFNQGLTDKVLDRQKLLMERGMTPSKALSKAVTEIDSEVGLSKHQ